MPSTFTTNLGIQKPANGEQPGTWGETVNINSDILDRAISGALSLSLSGTSSTLTTLQGVASNGQYKVLVLTGSPSGTHTITIDAATVQTLYLVVNSTAQSVIFTQGSGGNVTIVAGASAIISSDGAGATAKVTNITDTLAMSGVKITGGTITGVTITGITDLAVADGGTGASTLTGYVKGAGTAALTASATIPSSDISGLGTMAAQNASAVAITGGTVTGITPLGISAGGTGAADAAGALSNFGITATAAELNYTDGVTSAIQTQLDAKAPLSSPALTGTPTAPTAAVGTSTTQVATTAFVQAASGYDAQIFTGAGTWTKPVGAPATALVRIQMWGGGGGGGRDSESGGGGGGAYLEYTVSASTFGATQAVGVGSGGAGRTSGSGSGTAGGNSTFSTFTAFGGGGGSAGASSSDGGGGGGLLGAGSSNAAGLFGGATGANSGTSNADATLPTQMWCGGGGGAHTANSPSAGYFGGGGGGGGGGTTNGASSVFGGAGGNGSNTGAAGNGTAPAGGGGGTNGGTAGTGGRGEVRVYTTW